MTRPKQQAQEAVRQAAAAADKAAQTQKPYNDALAAREVASQAANLAQQQHLIAERELDAAKAAQPLAEQAVEEAEATLLRTQADKQEAQQQASAAEQPLHCVSFSPDGKLLSTAGDSSRVQLWDGETGAPIATLAGHEAAIIACQFRDDGQLATAALDSTSRIWDLQPQLAAWNGE